MYMKQRFLADKVLEKILKELKNNIAPFLGDRLERIVLYGSRARGDYDADSDIDVAIGIIKLCD